VIENREHIAFGQVGDAELVEEQSRKDHTVRESQVTESAQLVI
jgi:hypothetical protein